MTVQHRKITVSLPGNLLEYADRRAQISRSQVISEALSAAQAEDQTRLAAEGYRFYAGEASEFVEFTDVPLQLVRSKRQTEARITELERRLGIG